MTLRHKLQIYLGPVDRRQVQQEAAARGVSVSRCVTDCLREFFALRAEMATAVQAPGSPGGPHPPGVIHTLLARTEERLTATLDTRIGDLTDALHVVQSMVDRFALTYLMHTPEVPEHLRDGAVASARRRYENYRRAVQQQMQAHEAAGLAGSE